MPAEPVPSSLRETIDHLEQRVAELRDGEGKSQQAIEQLRRQVHDLFEILDEHKTTVRDVDTRVVSLKGIPDQLRSIGESSERVHQEIAAVKAELANTVRLLQSESGLQREESANAVRRIDTVVGDLELLTAEVSRIQAQVTNASQVAQTLLARQQAVESSLEQISLRLERGLEVNKDVEERIRTELLEDQEARFDVIYERLQVVGEMVKRNEESIQEATAEKTLRDDVLQEIGVWRDQHTRLENRMGTLEEMAADALNRMDRLQDEITLVEGRHTGLSERVATIRRDIAEVVDHVRQEFSNFNQMVERQRRKQIQGLEQELREMKFHAFHPPEEQ